MRVIVNADDLGISEGVNAAIFHMMSLGRITSATIIANGPSTAEAVTKLKDYRDVSFGVHLNITQFAPLSPTSKLKPILNEAGMFRRDVGQTRWSVSLLSAVAEELGAQIEYLLSRGVSISHIDSHHHVHTLAAMFPVVKYLQARFRIRRVRISRNYYSNDTLPSPKVLRKKRLFNAFLAGAYRTRTTDGFSDLFTFIDNSKAGSLKCGSFEIMVHPGVDQREDDTLMSPWEVAVPHPLEFINFHDL